MSSQIQKLRSSPDAGARGHPGLAVRALTRLRRNRLDSELARGADPGASAELGLRAAQLVSAAGRTSLANALVRALGEARRPNLGAFTLRARRRHDAIRDSADDVDALVSRLRDDRPIAVRGAAMTALLVNDRASQLRRESAQEIQHAIRAARVALDATSQAGADLAAAA
jgi:hypothetical protein